MSPLPFSARSRELAPASLDKWELDESHATRPALTPPKLESIDLPELLERVAGRQLAGEPVTAGSSTPGLATTRDQREEPGRVGIAHDGQGGCLWIYGHLPET